MMQMDLGHVWSCNAAGPVGNEGWGIPVRRGNLTERGNDSKDPNKTSGKICGANCNLQRESLNMNLSKSFREGLAVNSKKHLSL